MSHSRKTLFSTFIPNRGTYNYRNNYLQTAEWKKKPNARASQWLVVVKRNCLTYKCSTIQQFNFMTFRLPACCSLHNDIMDSIIPNHFAKTTRENVPILQSPFNSNAYNIVAAAELHSATCIISSTIIIYYARAFTYLYIIYNNNNNNIRMCVIFLTPSFCQVPIVPAVV